MPQLDILTFLNSYIWFLIIFFGFFYVFSIFLLPNIYFVFRVREKYYSDLRLIDSFTSEFNKCLKEVNLGSPKPILFETSAGLRHLNTSELVSASLKSYSTVLESLNSGFISASINQQYMFYILSYSTLIPVFSAVTILTADYTELSDF